MTDQNVNSNSMYSKPFRIGAVSYLNTVPLVHELAGRSGIDLVLDLPSRLADRLAAGELDVALIPSIEVFQNPKYTIVSDACIACRGPVWSVKLMSRVEPASIRTLALDEGSRTSAALVRLMLQMNHEIAPQLMPLEIDQDWKQTTADAVLIIGDRAMISHDYAEFPVQIDMGQWWFESTGLPFVFAMWTARSGLTETQLNSIGQLLSECRDRGFRASADLAKRHATEYQLTEQQALDYFQKFLHFKLGPDERSGLSRFRQLATQMQLAPESWQLQFHDC